MKKFILAFVALAFAFAISSCCDQSYCPGNKRCAEMREKNMRRGDRNQGSGEETPYRWDTQGQQQQQQQQSQERQHRRW
jgi:hypothetical protein